MTRSDKKTKERRHIDFFLSLFEEYNDEQIIESEAPDFIVKINGIIYGIEHTQYLRKTESGVPILKIKENYENMVRENIDLLCKSEMSIPIVIGLGWHPKERINKKDVKRITTLIFKMIKSSIPKKGDSIVLKSKDGLPSCLTYLYIWHTDSVSKPTITMSRSTWDVTIAINDIQRILNSKEDKIPRYREKCREVWIVIFAEGGAPSSIASLDQDIITYPFTSSFDRLYFCDIGNRYYVRLNKHTD